VTALLIGGCGEVGLGERLLSVDLMYPCGDHSWFSVVSLFVAAYKIPLLVIIASNLIISHALVSHAARAKNKWTGPGDCTEYSRH
jgi:hypothetical protein